MLTQHNRKTCRLSPDYTFAIRELGVWSGDETSDESSLVPRLFSLSGRESLVTNGNILVIFVMASLDLRLPIRSLECRLNLGNDRHEALPRQLKASLLIVTAS